MRALKLFFIFLFCVLFCACATLLSQNAKEPLRAYPVFLQSGETSAAFKFNIKSLSGHEYNAVLVLNKKENSVKIKMLADFATVLIDADLNNGNLTYNYVLGNMFDEKALEFLGDIIKIILISPRDFINASNTPEGELRANYRGGGFINRYYFKKEANYPYKLEQIRLTVRKKILFNDYRAYGDINLPREIICEDGHNLVKITLDLISLK
ncbi:MAG: hypothetical protein LBG46_03740 [Elusimicrobiota bacterium]|jgi:hypothetical protein|nr:hypothetical protein [Elusimicrobiota bacterium]